MALPPTRLTLLLNHTTTPAAAYEALSRGGCLSAEGLAAPERVTALLAASARDPVLESATEPRDVGPTADDRAAAALIGSPYLSAHGRRLQEQAGGGPPARPWWRFWT